MKDILFVDDERELLDGLRARLYKHRHDWNMKFVVSGPEAIAEFERQHVDLIVSDVRMPGMDGGQLLSVVKERWPTTVRIIVSGYSDPVQAARLTSLAHQYVAKPCDGGATGEHRRAMFLPAGSPEPGDPAQGGGPHRHAAGHAQDLRPPAGGAVPAHGDHRRHRRHRQCRCGDREARCCRSRTPRFFRLRKPMVRIKDAVTYLGFRHHSQSGAYRGGLLAVAEPPGPGRFGSRAAARSTRSWAAAACKSVAGPRTLSRRCLAGGPAARHWILDPDPGMSQRTEAGHGHVAGTGLAAVRMRTADGGRQPRRDRRLSAGPVGPALSHRRSGGAASHAGHDCLARLRSAGSARGIACAAAGAGAWA